MLFSVDTALKLLDGYVQLLASTILFLFRQCSFFTTIRLCQLLHEMISSIYLT